MNEELEQDAQIAARIAFQSNGQDGWPAERAWEALCIQSDRPRPMEMPDEFEELYANAARNVLRRGGSCNC